MARLRFEQSRTALAFDTAGGPLADGFPSAAAWLRANTMAAPGEAKDLVSTGRALRDRLPATAEAAADGQLGWSHASAIAHALRQVRDPDVLAEADRALAEVAPTLNPSGIPHTARRLLQHLDPDLAQRDAAERYADRGLTLSPMLDGAVSVHGQLDEGSAAVILSALSPMMTPLGPSDSRTAAQRRADALVELVGKAAEAGAAGTMTGTGLPPTLLVRVDIAALAGLHSPARCPKGAAGDAETDTAADLEAHASTGDHRDQAGRCDQPPGARPPVPDPAEVDWGGPILRRTLERIGCTAQIIRIVTDGPSQVLGLGRGRRLASPAQKLALAARDKGCIFPGCDRPPGWTDAHHFQRWADGGTTDIDDLGLFCRFHHGLLHEGGWTLHRTTTGLDFIDPHGQARGHYVL